MPTASTSQIEKMYESAAGLKTKNMDVSQTENNEDICWRLLYYLKPEYEKQADIEKTGIDEQLCEKCNSREIIVIEGEHLCKSCNVIQSRVIEDTAEWRFY